MKLGKINTGYKRDGMLDGMTQNELLQVMKYQKIRMGGLNVIDGIGRMIIL
jgi:hypothetical protein